MTKIMYKCSNGKDFDLIGSRMRTTSGYLHEYAWEPKEIEMEVGASVYAFGKSAKTYDITLTLRGSLEERKKILDELMDCFEYDVANKTPGKVTFGDYGINCYVKAAKTQVSSTRRDWTDCAVTIYCPYPMWAQEQKKSFYQDERGKGETYAYLDYPKEYKYDYSKPTSGAEHWYIDHYTSSHFEMLIYGPCANPRITISDQVYEIYDTLEAGEYIKLESRTKTITKHLTNGSNQNIFYKKPPGSSVFEKIPPGDLLISWNGEFGFDITAYKERSMPKWT